MGAEEAGDEGPPDEIGRIMREDWDRRAARDYKDAISFWEAESEEAFFEAGVRIAAMVRDILKLPDEPRARVLEIGCGVARIAAPLAASVGRVDAIDVSDEMIRRARERFGGTEKLELHVGSGTSLEPFEAGAFDAVYANGVFHHVPRAVFHGYLVEIARVLRPGGVLAFNLMDPHGFRRRFRAWLGLEPDARDPHRTRYYGERVLARYAPRFGFRLREMRRGDEARRFWTVFERL